MSDKTLLITYATRTGWTVGVAEAIGHTLAESGLQVDVLAMQEVKSLARYQAVVAGSAIQSKAWLPEAMQFVRAHQQDLQSKPFAAFLLCMTLAMPKGESYRDEVATWLNPVSALVRPVSTGLFTGGLDISRMKKRSDKLMFRISVLLGVWKEGDFRDWNAIRAWALQLPPLLFP